MNILKKIKELRKAKGYSQKYMAEQLHISTSGYGKIEIGENVLSVERLLDICRILNITSYNQVLPAINIDSVNQIEKVLYTAGMAFESIHNNVVYLSKLIERLQGALKIEPNEKNAEILVEIKLIDEYLKIINSESVKNGYNLTSMKNLVGLID